MTNADFARPHTIEEAVGLLAETQWSILAGGTDFYPGLRDRIPAGPVMDISAVRGLRDLGPDREHYRIGALATWSDLLACPLPPAFDALKLAAREVGSVQIQNRGTIVGNLCNASPAADGVPPLQILNAEVELTARDGAHRLPLAEFILGNRKTARRADELVTAVLVPMSAAEGASHFLKLGARRYLVISIAMVAARLCMRADGTIAEAAVSVGSCSEVARRLPGLEQALAGRPADALVGSVVTADHLAGLEPIDDVRATGAYRREAALELVRRALAGCTPEATAA